MLQRGSYRGNECACQGPQSTWKHLWVGGVHVGDQYGVGEIS